MTPTVIVPQSSEKMKLVRVFVKGGFGRYGECSEKALFDAIKQRSKVRVTFTYWKPIDRKHDVIVNTTDEMVDTTIIKYKTLSKKF